MADPSSLPPLPKNHLDHPENWATGTEPATDKQKGFIKVLEGQHPEAVPENGIDVAGLGKSEASEVIDKLKNGKKVTSTGTNGDDAKEEAEQSEAEEAEEADVDAKKGDKEEKTTTDGASQTPDKPTQPRPVTPHKTSTLSKAEKRKTPPSATERADKDASKADEDADADMNGEDDEGEAALAAAEERVTKKTKVDDDSNGTVDKQAAPAKGESSPAPDNIAIPPEEADTSSKNAANGQKGETIPGDGEHLDHPENWATGDEPATEKQKGFIAVLEKKAGEPVENLDGLGKSEASAKIEELK